MEANTCEFARNLSGRLAALAFGQATPSPLPRHAPRNVERQFDWRRYHRRGYRAFLASTGDCPGPATFDRDWFLRWSHNLFHVLRHGGGATAGRTGFLASGIHRNPRQQLAVYDRIGVGILGTALGSSRRTR